MRYIAAVLSSCWLLLACAADGAMNEGAPVGTEAPLAVSEAVGGFSLRMGVPTAPVPQVDEIGGQRSATYSIWAENSGDRDLTVTALLVEGDPGERVWAFEGQALGSASSIPLGEDGGVTVPAGAQWHFLVRLVYPADEAPETLSTYIRVQTAQAGTTLSSRLLLGQATVEPR